GPTRVGQHRIKLPRTRTPFVGCVATFVLPSVPSRTPYSEPAKPPRFALFIARHLWRRSPERTVRVTSQQSTFRVRRGPRAHPRPPCCPRPLRRHSVSPSRSARRLRQKCRANSSPAAQANDSFLSTRARR